MVQLLNLSNELHLLIISELPPESARSLALVNRRLHQLANPRLYETVLYCADSPGFCDEEHSHRASALRINDLNLLTRTLQKSTFLRPCVKRVELTWGLEAESVDTEKVLRFLDIMKHTRFESLILSPPSTCFEIPGYTAVKNLQFRPQRVINVYKKSDPIVQWIHYHCCILGLEEFSYGGNFFWGQEATDLTMLTRSSNTALDRAKTSPVEKLHMFTWDMSGHILNEILSWPKALRVLDFECEPPNGIVHRWVSNVAWENVVNPLEHCRETLEELHFHCLRLPKHPFDTILQPVNLSAYSALKRLRIRSDFLIFCRRLHEDAAGNVHHSRRLPKFFEVLPRSLEHLRLDTGDQGFLESREEGPINLQKAIDWFLDHLEDLALRKADHLPNLTRVVSGESASHRDNDEFWKIMRCYERPSRLKAIFARENIQLSFWRWDCKKWRDEPQEFQC